jgi:hypothetical protein
MDKETREIIKGIIEFMSDNDYTYLPSKGYWVNEEEEESEKIYSSDEIIDLWYNKFKENIL